jgi:phosphoglycolate phosphatase
VEKAEKKRQLIGNVISAMKLREEAELACGSQPVQSASVVWRPAHTASATTNLSDPEAAFNAATAALDKALDRAEVILTWVLGSEAKGMTLEKAQRALTSVENLVRERREGARLAADPVQAAALVEKAEKKQQLISSVIDAMRLKEDAELALRQQGTSNGAKRSALITEAEKKALVDKTDVFVFDCDGVIWKGDKLIDGVPETLDMLKAMGKRMFFVTNNSTKSRKGYLKKFQSLGLKVEANEIYSSSYAAAAYLQSIDFPKDKKVYVIGEVGIQEELDLVGIRHIGGPADAGKVVELTPGLALDHDKDVAAVVVGFDRYFNYHKIQTAQLCINENPGCMFIATNTDAVTHLTDAQEWAGNGSMVGCIKGCTNREPTVVGKPSGFMLDNIAKTFSIDKSKICMVGDRLDTDILFGQHNGTNTMLVFTGVTTPETLAKSPVNPDNLIPGIADLLTLKR